MTPSSSSAVGFTVLILIECGRLARTAWLIQASTASPFSLPSMATSPPCVSELNAFVVRGSFGLLGAESCEGKASAFSLPTRNLISTWCWRTSNPVPSRN